MTTIFILRSSLKPDAYFSPLENDFKSESLSVVMVSPKDFDVFSKGLSDSQNIAILDFEIFSEDPDFIKMFFKKTKAASLLFTDFENEKSKEWKLRELCLKNQVLEGLIDTSRDIQFSYPLIRSVLRKAKMIGQSIDTEVLGKSLNQMINTTLSELQRIKKLHEQLVPMREEKIKFLKLTSKFAAGMSSGGEFFDVIKKDNYAIILLTSSKSYVSSSIILSHFEALREKKDVSVEDIEYFYEGLIDECRGLELLDREEPEKLELLLLRIDFKDLSFCGHQFGRSFKVSNYSSLLKPNSYPFDENFFDKSYFEGKLKRGEKVALVSSGVFQNLNEMPNGQGISEFISAEMGRDSKDLLNEVFFQLKRKSDSDFLKHDASVILIEVDPNAIVQA